MIAAGSFLTLPDGSVRPAESIHIGDMVVSHSGTPCRVEAKTASIVAGKASAIEIVGRGRLVCTCDHPIYKLAVSASGAEDTPKHLFRHKSSRKELIFSRADSIKKYDLLLSVPVNACIPSDLTPAKARLAGLFAAEGCFGKKYNRYQNVRFTFNINELHVLAMPVKQMLEKEFNVPANIQERADAGTCEVVASGKRICEFFRHHVGEYSGSKFLSAELTCGSSEIKQSFLAGWLDGDGCVERKQGQIVGVSISRNLISGISLMLTSLKTAHCISKTKGKKNIAINKKYRGYDTADSFRLTINATEGQDVVGRCWRLHFEHESRPRKHHNVFGEYMLHTVRRAETIYIEHPMHDIVVEKDHSYIVNGIIASDSTR